MKTAQEKKLWVIVLAALALCLAPVIGQGQQNPPSVPPGQSAPPAKPAPSSDAPTPPPINPEEETAYKAMFDLKGSEFQRQIQLGEDFLKKYPASRYAESVYSRLASAYLAAGDVDKMFAAGEKALELKPDDVDVLALMALVMPRRLNTSALDAAQRLDRAEKYARQGIELLATLPKPATLTDADFARAKNDKLSMCHSGLGFIHFYRQKYADSASELEQAAKLSSAPDPVDFFLLGTVLHQMKRYNDAVSAYGHCSELGGPMQARCKQAQDAAKKLAATELTTPK